MERLGIPFDAVAGECVTQEGKAWCERRFGKIRFFRANYSLYGPEIPGILARGWAHRMQHFFNLELHDPAGSALVYTPAMVAEYQETTEMERLAEGQAAGWPAQCPVLY